MSRILVGKSISNGLAVGKIRMINNPDLVVMRKNIDDVEEEVARYKVAGQEAIRQVGQLYEQALKEIGPAPARIFEAHQAILEDESYASLVEHMIRQEQVNAEYAVSHVCETFEKMFAEMEDEYFRARCMDVKDISGQLIRILSGMSAEEENGDGEPCIIMARDLTPSDTLQLDRAKLLGIITECGTYNSHTAILARTMEIPVLTDISVDNSFAGKTVIVDGFAGELILEPDETLLKHYQNRIGKEDKKRIQLQEYKGKETVNRYGKKVSLYANIGDLNDLDAVFENDAEGIGLFRSEFLYLKESDYPTEEDLFQAYKQVAELMNDKWCVIRTMDISADKTAGYFDLKKEENPALGYRAIRICLTREELFRTQLRAILRAGAYGNISVMYPMITSVWEVCRVKEIVEEVKRELAQENIPYGLTSQGIMIETPAAALISDLLAKEVDFFSIGTNDLSQYTLALDRQNAGLELFFDPYHEAVLRLIRMTVENGHGAGIPVGICGEMAADIQMTDFFMSLGVDALSVAPVSVLPVRKAIIGEKNRTEKCQV